MQLLTFKLQFNGLKYIKIYLDFTKIIYNIEQQSRNE